MAGGYVEEPAPASSAPNSTAKTSANGHTPLLSLTPRQESRLCTHLDDRLLSLERDERKQAFISIPSLLDRLYPLLHLILQIPPVAPWADLRVSYLLNLTGFVATYVTSLPLLPPSTMRARGAEAEREAGRVMRDVLGFLGEVERGWMAVLAGQGWVMDDLEEDEGAGSGRRSGHGVHVEFSGSVGQTERTRLRSIIISSRAKFTAWARTYGSFAGSILSTSTPVPIENGARRTMGCEGPADFDPDPPTTYAPPETNGSGPTASHSANGEIGGWEDRILGMWNTVLERLTDQDLGQQNGR